MPIPALIVGLGGTGTWVATYIKKELLENSNTWPVKEVRIVAFDTDKDANRKATIGGKGQVRQGKQTTGAVRLETGEFFYIGGNVQNLMKEVVNGRHPQLDSWLLADWYLRTLADKTFNLNEGAGQFRQFGRLAVFQDVAAPSNSIIYNTLEDALTKIKRNNPGMSGLQVFIVGSLAGGTGAGMVPDIAHLVRVISEQSKVDLKGKMTIRGYLVLPDAFSRDVDQAWLTSMYARAYAAMRENRRFTVSFDYERGYPMYYHNGSGHPVWHGAVKGRLFDMIYYLDGQGANSSLGAVSLLNGVTPAIADVISAAIDAQSGPEFASYVTNVEAERTSRVSRGEISNKTATYGSVGTYSLVFPIFHIMETWAHDLGLDVLNRLLVPTNFDARSGVPTQVAINANQENLGEDGRSAGFKFLRSLTPVSYEYRDDGGSVRTVQIEPTLLPGELARISIETARPGGGILQSLIGRNITDWNEHFIPRGDDRETRLLMQRVENILSARLYDPAGATGQVKASDQDKQKEDPILGAERIIGDVRIYKSRYLGDEDPRTGQRSGGLYRNALGMMVEHHINRFNSCLDLYIQATLNGSPNRPALEARGGKVGFLLDFLDGLFGCLATARETLQRVRQVRREQGESRRNAISSAQSAGQTMKSNADKKGFLGNQKEAYGAQHHYLQAEADLVDILQVEATEEAILDAVSQMIDYVHSAQQAMQGWVDTLAKHQDGLYAQLVRGRKQVESDRTAAKDVKVRHIVTDAAYEKARYDEYVSKAAGGWPNELMARLHWRLDHRMVAGKPKVELQLQVAAEPQKSVALGSDTFGDNLATWLGLCRLPFAEAKRTESVIGYLLQHREYRDPNQLAEMIHANSGALLGFNGGNPLPANFLRAYFQDEEEAGHRAYLRNVIQYLAQLSGQSTVETREDENGNTVTEESRFAKFTNSEDRFKFNLVFTQELIELERINSYRGTGHNAYLGNDDRSTKGDRRLLHIYPAEVNAVKYESRLAELKQTIRLFSDDVTLQLEDIKSFQLFLFCYIYQLIARAGVQDANDSQRNFWRLQIPPEQEFNPLGDKADPEELWLTDPMNPPRLLDALMTFNFVGKDNFSFAGKSAQGRAISRAENYVRLIDYEQVKRALARTREKDVNVRLQANSAGQYSPDLLGQVEAVADEDTRQRILRELARIDRVREMQAHFENNILPSYQTYLNDPDQQKDYDIASIFTLMLRDEIAEVRQTVQDTINSLRDLGATDSKPLPPPANGTKPSDLW